MHTIKIKYRRYYNFEVHYTFVEGELQTDNCPGEGATVELEEIYLENSPIMELLHPYILDELEAIILESHNRDPEI